MRSSQGRKAARLDRLELRATSCGVYAKNNNGMDDATHRRKARPHAWRSAPKGGLTPLTPEKMAVPPPEIVKV